NVVIPCCKSKYAPRPISYHAYARLSNNRTRTYRLHAQNPIQLTSLCLVGSPVCPPSNRARANSVISTAGASQRERQARESEACAAQEKQGLVAQWGARRDDSGRRGPSSRYAARLWADQRTKHLEPNRLRRQRIHGGREWPPRPGDSRQRR